MYCVHVCRYLPNDVKPEYVEYFNTLKEAACYVHGTVYDRELQKYRSVCLAGFSHHEKTLIPSYSRFSPVVNSSVYHTPCRVFDSYGNIVPPNVLVENYKLKRRSTYSYIPTGYKRSWRKSHANSNALSNAKREAESLYQENSYFKPSSRHKLAVRRARRGKMWDELDYRERSCHRSWKKYRRKQYR